MESTAVVGEGAWRLAHERLAQFAKLRSGMEWEEGRLLRDALATRAHARLGFGSFTEYVERLFGYAPRQTREKMRVAEALESLPELSRTLRTGDLTWSAVRELTRVAVPQTESDWCEASRGLTARDVEELVAGRRVGDRPSDLPDARVRRHVLRFDVSADTHALVAEAMAKLRRDTGGGSDDDSTLLLMARCVLRSERGGDVVGDASARANANRDEGRSSYQVALTICERCRRGEQLGNGRRNPVDTEVIDMCQCDAQHIGRVDLQAHSVSGEQAPSERRATQTIPPALRRSVMRRDDGRCVVSGCRNSLFVDVHHLVPRAAGGRHDADNLVCLCGAHHRAVHRGILRIEGTPSRGLVFSYSDGRRYGNANTTPRHDVDFKDQVLGALKHLGFRERELRQVIDECTDKIGRDATRESVLRLALVKLTRGAASPA